MLSVVIPATDAPPTLGRCLAALERSSERHRVAVVTHPPRSGPAAARNAGPARTSGEIIVFVDADGSDATLNLAWRHRLAGVPLHLVHHLTAAASVPAGLLLWARGR